MQITGKGKIRNVHKILIRSPVRKRLFGRRRLIWEVNINRDFSKILGNLFNSRKTVKLPSKILCFEVCIIIIAITRTLYETTIHYSD